MKPAIRILLIVIISFSFCQLIFVCLHYGSNKYSNHKHNRLNELLQNSSRYDLIFLGSSIVHNDIHPRIIDSICNISSYNAGVEGANLLEYKMMFDAYLVNHPPPNFLMLTLDLSSFNLDRKFFNHLDYYPYLSNKVIDQVLCDNGHQTALLKIFPFIELTEYDEEMRSRCVKGLLGKNEIMPGQIEYKGFLTCPLEFSSGNQNINNYLAEEKVSDGSLNLFQAIKDTCNARNVTLIINFPPVFKNEELKNNINSENIFKLIRSLAIENKIHFLEGDKLSLCTDSSLFSDYTHLNKVGAELYSAILAKELLGLVGISEWYPPDQDWPNARK